MKKEYFIKVNNKIRNYFNELPFDEGVILLEDENPAILHSSTAF